MKYSLQIFLVAFSFFLLFTDRNVWTLDGRIYYLLEGSTKPQIFRNWVKVTCLSYGKNCGMNSFLSLYFHCYFFSGGTIIINNFSQVNLLFYNEQYHQKLKHRCNFDKKQRSKTMFLSIKLYIWLTHARSHFQSKYSKRSC